MRSYNDLIKLVRDWSNRDPESVSNSIIANCLTYAADKAYRHLRVPPLEQTKTYSSATLVANTTPANNGSSTITTLEIPADLTDFIQIRAVDSEGKTTRVFNEKADVRTFFDPYAEKYSGNAFWTRHGNNILVSPGFTEDSEESIVLYYYRRLLELDTRFDVTASNANAGTGYVLDGTSGIPTNIVTGDPVPSAQLKEVVYTVIATSEVASTMYYETSVADAAIPAAPLGQTRSITTKTFYGGEVFNWLRDENERVLLNGALAEVFVYLNEPETAQRYFELFKVELEELNREETKRKASGGNVQINVNGYGLI